MERKIEETSKIRGAIVRELRPDGGTPYPFDIGGSTPICWPIGETAEAVIDKDGDRHL